MKKHFLTLFFVALCTLTKGQNISIDQVISLRTQPLASVEEFLTANKWQMIDAKQVSEGSMATFAYKKSADSDKAQSFLYVYYLEHAPNRLRIQMHKADTYNLYLARLKALGYKLKNSYVKDDSIFKIYELNGITVMIETSNHETDSATKTIYVFAIFYSLDYLFMFGK